MTFPQELFFLSDVSVLLLPAEGRRVIVLCPVPSSDPNEPLNWSPARKTCHFTLVLAVTCLVFTALSIQQIFWQLMAQDLNVTYTQLNCAISLNFVGLATGCALFTPFAKKYGRRPVYLMSTALMVVASFWSGEIKTLPELYITNLLQGLAGATNEAIVQITIVDLFFVHHRGGMNTLYITMMMIGSFLTPMAAGSQATRQGWRWSYRTMGISNAPLLVLFVFFYEESKYTPTIEGISAGLGPQDDAHQVPSDGTGNKLDLKTTSRAEDCGLTDPILDYSIPMRTWRERLPMVTYTSEPIWSYFYRPFVILFTFPAVLCCALQYTCGVVWLTILASMIALVFPPPPYEFTPKQIGYMSIGPFVGNLIDSFYGLIMFGATIDRGMHWILPSIGGALFGFGLGSISGACLTLVTDSYMDITGDAFTGVAFLRNAFSIGIPFAISPWMERSGLTNTFIACGFISLGVTLTLLEMVIYGKRIRQATARRYHEMAGKEL
ncbi:putative MFS transporter [Aspergillus alliaceus]|uniref:putative MFS transporter n=1 Tax=Petromyces alliaceus TaxID=209559 RepID=UPI0012A3C13A|nr:major facilitator superfamily domain-containing protein [Aspergillus alliaceus]KAB8230402.1 major facilitator superfamily domain-containing protein [Aspergillus alliaceus]